MTSPQPPRPPTGFSPATLRFLKDLAANNNREWFEANRPRYEADVVNPALQLIQALRPRMLAVSPHYPAVARKSGGSMTRIYRDLRFARDRAPYKTHVAIHLQHVQAKTTTCPGFYMSFDPNLVFFGVGCWKPKGEALLRLRQAIQMDPSAWLAARDDRAFRSTFHLGGESLKRAPKGCPQNHALLEDLRRKDFVGYCERPPTALFSDTFADQAAAVFSSAACFMRFLCRALEVPF